MSVPIPPCMCLLDAIIRDKTRGEAPPTEDRNEDDEADIRATRSEPRTKTMRDVLADLGIAGLEGVRVDETLVRETLLKHNPASYLYPVLHYAAQLHERHLFPLQRAVSEAFLAVPESDIIANAQDFLAEHSDQQEGGGPAQFFRRRWLRSTNAADYSQHFLRVLQKFARAIGAAKTLALVRRALGEEGGATAGGGKSMKDVLAHDVTSEELDDVIVAVIAPYYEAAEAKERAATVTYGDTKVMKRLVMRNVMKAIRKQKLLGKFNNVATKYARRLTDEFYMVMSYAVVAIQEQLADSPEKERFVRMYQHTTAYCVHSHYNKSYMRLQFSYADSEPTDALTHPDLAKFFCLIGANFAKHYVDASFTAKLQRWLTTLSMVVGGLVLVAMVVALSFFTMGGAFVPLLLKIGMNPDNAAMAAEIIAKYIRSSRLLVRVTQQVRRGHKVAVNKRDTKIYKNALRRDGLSGGRPRKSRSRASASRRRAPCR